MVVVAKAKAEVVAVMTVVASGGSGGNSCSGDSGGSGGVLVMVMFWQVVNCGLFGAVVQAELIT